MMDKRIGFIGLGAMGKPMALNLVKAGMSVTVTYHRNRAPAEELKRAGARMVDSVSEVAQSADTVITVLPADREIEEVYLSGLIDNLKEGAVCIDMTTALPQTIIEVEKHAGQRGIRVLDAPVSGGIARAQSGSLTIMVGGDGNTIEQCRPILQAMGERILFTGGVGSGKGIKMINQLLNAGNTYIASEALVLAEKLNLDLNTLVDVVGASSGGSWVFQNLVPKFVIPKNFKPGFKLNLMKKDIDLSLQSAKERGVSLPVMSLIGQIYQSVINQGHGDKYYCIVSQWVENLNHR
jgi:3-hydroxyisobutyrate dehydrogenase-like beta-hydroxyacid dehydrogenase